MTSGIFTRIRLFTDVEDITLDKWLDAENSGQDELAKKILDAGLVVEHMIAEIPLDQNLADNSELKQIADNAKTTFGLIGCFGCNRAFSSKDEQVINCPNCRAKLSGPQLIHPRPKGSAAETTRKQPSPALLKTKKQASHKELEKPENQRARKGRNKVSPPLSPSHLGDEGKEDWFDSTGQSTTGQPAVTSK